MIIAAEMGAPIRITSGPAIQHAGDLAAILSSLQEGEVLFLDEIHRMSRPAEEMLYMAMEDFRVDVIVGKGPGATAIPLELPPFTLVGATTRAGLLPPPLRDRFGFTAPHGVLRPRRAGARHPPLRPAPRRRDRRRRRRRDRRPLPRHAPYRQPAAAPRPRLRPGQGGRPDHPRDRRGRPRGLRGGRPRPRPARPGRARGPAQAVRRRPGRPVHARGRGGGGARDRRGGRRALPGPGGPAGPHPPRPGRHPRRLGPPRTRPAAARPRAASGQQGLFGA